MGRVIGQLKLDFRRVCAGLMFVLAAPALATATTPLTTPPPPQTEMPERPRVWAQDYVPIKPDPAVRYGTLPNGVRYAIMHNETLKGHMSMRMRMATGSLDEHDDQRGFAHFLEHMAFRGSTHIPDGEVRKLLERKGLAFGADINASTDYNETIYKFDFPDANADTIGTGLKIFRDIATNLNITAQAMATERDVVLAEERQSHNVMRDMAEASTAFTNQGQLIADRLPIGLPAQIKSATPAQLRAFYDAHYRPSNTVLIIVGDFNVNMVEAAIKAQFNTWHDARPVVDADLGKVAQRGTSTKLFTAPGAIEVSGLGWRKPYNGLAESHTTQMKNWQRMIGFGVLNMRLQEAANKPDAPYLQAGANYSITKSNEGAGLTVLPQPGKWREALSILVGEQHRILRDGVLQSEIDRVVTNTRQGLKAQTDNASTRASDALAAAQLAHVAGNDVYKSPAQHEALFSSLVPTFTPEAVTDALRTAFTGQGPLFFLSTKDMSITEAAMKQALDDANARTLEAYKAEEKIVWPYTNFGTPSAIVKRETFADLDFTRVSFANGTQLIIKKTDFDKDRIMIAVDFGKGLLGLSKTLHQGEWLEQALTGFDSGGLNKLDLNALNHSLEGKVVGLGAGNGLNRTSLSATTRPVDLALQMQVLAAFATDPAYRPEGTNREIGILSSNYAFLDSTPQMVYGRKVSLLLNNNDPRFAIDPTLEDIKGSSMAQVKAAAQAALGSTPYHITIVGDVDIEAAIASVAQTFGALPAAPPFDREAFTRAEPAFSIQGRTAPYVYTHKGPANQAMIAFFWPVPDYYANIDETKALHLASGVISSRLIDELRTRLGLTYSPQVGVSQSSLRKGYSEMQIVIECTPDKVSDVEKAILNVTDALSKSAETKVKTASGQIITVKNAGGVSKDDRTRAVEPMKKERLAALRTNSFWFSALRDVHWDSGKLSETRDYGTALDDVNEDAISAVISKYVAGKLPLKVEVLPVGAAAAVVKQ